MSIHAFIEPFLDKGDEAIAVAKKQFYREYKAAWRRRHRREVQELTLTFSKEEAQELRREARKAKRPVSKFVKACCLAYLNKVYLVADPSLLLEIRQLLAMNYNGLLKLKDEKVIPKDIGLSILHQMSDFEQKLLSKLHNPKSLEQWIQDSIKEKSGYQDTILLLLNSADNGD